MAIRKPRRKSSRQLWFMLALIVLILVAIVLLPSGEGNADKAAGHKSEIEASTLVEVGDPAPEFTVELFDGGTVSLAELRGKVVLLNFWATWCPPCREELTHVQSDIIDRFAGRPFVFLPISRGESHADVAAFREQTGYDVPMGLDSTRSIYNRYASNYIPRNFLIDADGKIVTATVGFDETEFEELIHTIETTLAKTE